MSSATYYNGSEAGKSFRKLVRFCSEIRFFPHTVQLLTVFATSLAMCSQKYCRRRERNMRVTPGCPANRGKCSKWRRRGRRESGTTICFAPSCGAFRTSMPAS
jgi:hypothetical protein